MKGLVEFSSATEACTVKVNGKPFRCHCGCNVFNHGSSEALAGELYECNACGELYEATP